MEGEIKGIRQWWGISRLHRSCSLFLAACIVCVSLLPFPFRFLGKVKYTKEKSRPKIQISKWGKTCPYSKENRITYPFGLPPVSLLSSSCLVRFHIGLPHFIRSTLSRFARSAKLRRLFVQSHAIYHMSIAVSLLPYQ